MDRHERELLRRLLTALLREDAYGLGTGARVVAREDGAWTRVPAPDGGTLLVPVGEDGFLSELAVRRPLVEHHPRGGGPPAELTTLDAVLELLRQAAPPAERTRFTAFAAECRAELDAARRTDTLRPALLPRLARRYGARPAEDWTGLTATLAYDTLAAWEPHPVHPAGRARHGLGEDQLAAYAPEYHPRFAPRWIALPRTALSGDPDRLPRWWPTPGALGLPGLDRSHLALPAHPLTGDTLLAEALRDTGLAAKARIAERTWPPVRPTLSMRTVAVLHDPAIHLKLPLPTATLGALNRRTIKPGTLTDGAVAQRLLETVLDREPALARVFLPADETTFLHAGHEYLAALVRRHPAGLDRCRIVPVAALPATGPGGRTIAEHLADHYHDGDLTAFLDAYLDVLLPLHTTLFGYGIALESHQQNTSLVLDRVDGGRPRLRLLVKDHDGPRVHPGRLGAALGDPAAARALCGFDDPRILTERDTALTDVFTTITLHLCAAAPLLALQGPRPGRAGAALALLRRRLAEAVERLDGRPGDPGRVLRARVLDADRLPIKAMVTAGSLYSKQRSGAADINKHYTSGPNYLRPSSR
ncbi:IucA/IucC family protein [Streptomyces palmae]|uniref:IucA/IucC family siderophore biosynthesis protein n=1 Tax=Streptomyces palmae TaxID=1701085 RepID=A0A4Z0FP64_9ACTN|nr:IucA/IucC family protein [Streptomyces palmae]TGA84770.1 IucA/IucC family siderophore biosynthesis protein [Streptomyces palmae]